LLDNHRSPTLFVMTCFLLGSLRALWPFGEEQDASFFPMLLMFVLGIAIILAFLIAVFRIAVRKNAGTPGVKKMKARVCAVLASVALLSGCVTNTEPALPEGWEEIKPERVDAIAAMIDDADGVLTAGTNPPFAPFEFKDDKGQIVGVEMDLAR